MADEHSPSFLHHLQLVSHDLAAIRQKKWQKRYTNKPAFLKKSNHPGNTYQNMHEWKNLFLLTIPPNSKHIP